MNYKSAKGHYNKLLADKLIQSFKCRNIESYYFASQAEGLHHILNMIPKESTVACGGSMTLSDIGLKDALKDHHYNFLDPADIEIKDKEGAARQALTSDYYLMSTNAIALSGELVNADGIGNRVAALCFGPKNIIIVAGINKVESNLDAAISRVKDYSAKLATTAYKRNFESYNALEVASEDSYSQIVITHRSMFKNRIKVILIGENLGI